MIRHVAATVTVVMFSIGSSAFAQTVNIITATIQNGNVHVEGSQASRRTAVSWEGSVVGTTTAGGAFSFNSTILPADCVGLLTIGAASRNVVLNGCTPAAITVVEAGVPQTGFMDSFEVGDDGDLEKGVVLPAPRFTDNVDGTVTDNLTRLIWLKNAHCEVLVSGTAMEVVAVLNATGTMGGAHCGDVSKSGSHQTDWRVPNVREFLSLLNYAYNDPALSNFAGTGQATNGDPFVNLQSDYKTSTRQADCGGACPPYGFNFYNGKVDENGFGAIWAVRGGD
jgi:hypothetical protein